MNLLPTEIAHIIARRCDTPTHANFCFAYKSLYIYDSEWMRTQQTNRFIRSVEERMVFLMTRRGAHSRLKAAHTLLRYMVLHKHILRRPQFGNLRPVVKTKLLEFGQTGMCKRKVRKYMKDLEL